MKPTEYIVSKINRFPKGYIFTYSDFIQQVDSREAIIKALNRLAAVDRIVKLSKGKFYKPEETPFGKLQPDQEQIVKDLLETNSKPIGYLTGYSIYNKLGLSTQVSNIIQIGKNQVRPGFKRERYTITFIQQKNIITRENIPLLQLLDTIRYIKKIPDSTIEASLTRMLTIIKSLPLKEKETMVRLSLKYPPSTRALLGSLLEEMGQYRLAEPICKTLNPITKYKLKGVEKAISNPGKWNLL